RRQLIGFIDDLSSLIDLFALVGNIFRLFEPVFDFGLLRVNWRVDRGQAGVAMESGMLDDRFAERIMLSITRSFGRLRSLETHVVPAEIFQISADLAETLGTHRRASATLSGQ